jgi:transcriptional regulator with XRE-family HTH domain
MGSVADSLAHLGVDSKRLVRRTGLSAERVKEILGGAEPTVYELRTIASYLRLPADALMRVRETTGRADLRYRAEPLKQPPLTAEARIQELGKLLQRLDLLPPRKLDLRVFASLENLRSVEDAALLIRQAFCTNEEMLDPLPDLATRIDQCGLAYSVVLADLGVEGANGLLDGRGLIVIAARTFKPRASDCRSAIKNKPRPYSCTHPRIVASTLSARCLLVVIRSTRKAFQPNCR